MPVHYLKIVFICIALCTMHPACAASPDGAFVFYLVRHAEKAFIPDDPPLSGAGRQRSERLAAGLADRNIKSIWSSDYKRTRATAAPLANRLGLEVEIYDPRSQAEFADRLVAGGENVLVVGHSNTIPQLAALLCHCEVAPIRETEYGRMFVITVDRHGLRLAEVRQRAYFRGSAQP